MFSFRRKKSTIAPVAAVPAAEAAGTAEAQTPEGEEPERLKKLFDLVDRDQSGVIGERTVPPRGVRAAANQCGARSRQISRSSRR